MSNDERLIIDPNKKDNEDDIIYLVVAMRPGTIKIIEHPDLITSLGMAEYAAEKFKEMLFSSSSQSGGRLTVPQFVPPPLQ
jgi:hypothetical protein